MHLRERRPIPARALMPGPAPLPSLPNALARRAAIFGPFDLDEAVAACRDPQQTLRLERSNFAASRLRCGRSNFVRLRLDHASHHARVLRQHDLGRSLCHPSALLGLAAVLVAHLCLLCWSSPA